MGRRGRRPHPDVLTPREWEVIDLLRERLTNEQIADVLSITLDGAKYHVSQILSKLGVGTREEAAAWTARGLRPSWRRRITLSAAAAIAGALTLAGAVGALGLLAWGVVETGGPPESDESAQNSEPSDPAPSVALAECKDSVPVALDGRAACEFGFEAKDFPARLQAQAMLTNPQHGYPFSGVIVLDATCAPAGSCLNLKTGEPVTVERTSQIDWEIVDAATIVITSHHELETDSIPVERYRFVGLQYSHFGEEVCGKESGFSCQYVFFANYEDLTSGEPPSVTAPGRSDVPTPEISAFCLSGTFVELEGEVACSFTFDATDVPAAFTAFPILDGQSQMGDIKLYAACAPQGSCVDFVSGEGVAEKKSGRIDWKIVAQATITINSYRVIQPDTIPAQEYRFIDFEYEHLADPICTGERLYCYTYIANYERVQ